jgi:hypothetical protein
MAIAIVISIFALLLKKASLEWFQPNRIFL